jgi:hypothetical protein
MERASVIEENTVMQFRYKIAVLSENHTKPINSLYGENYEILNVKTDMTHNKTFTLKS